jgi:putative SOS response-associated peptidase YedK
MKSAEAQPYAIAVKDHSPFTMPGFGKNWKNPTGEWVRTFAVLTTPANELIAMIRDRVPAALAPRTTTGGSERNRICATC